MNIRSCIVLLGVVCCLKADVQTPSKGTEIGQTINDAVTAALPVTKLIADAVKAVLPSGDKVKKSDLDAAVKKAADQARADAIDASNRQLERLKGVFTEIQIATELGENARLASANLTVIRSRLTNQLSDAGWDQIKDEWNKIAKKSVSDVVGFDQKKLDQISDPDVQRELATLKNTHDRDVADFETAVNGKNQATALTLLFQISERLDNVESAPIVELKSFGSQLVQLSKGTPKGSSTEQPALPPPPPPPPETSPLGRLLQNVNAKQPMR